MKMVIPIFQAGLIPTAFLTIDLLLRSAVMFRLACVVCNQEKESVFLFT